MGAHSSHVEQTNEPGKYSVIETLRDGSCAKIRALRPEGRAAILAAVDRVSAQSLYRRFFGPRRSFSDAEVDSFMNIDFISHVALVAVVDEVGREAIVADGRYVVVSPGTAELGFAVIDAYQGKGIGSALLRHLVLIARAAGLRELIADVLPENARMLAVFKSSGLPAKAQHQSGAVHVTLILASNR